MKRTYLHVAVLLLAGSLFFVSCKKGDQGPAGTANVIYSDWLDVTFNQTVRSPGDTIYIALIDAPKLTNDIINNGDVKVFVNVNTPSSPAVVPLPNYDPFLVIGDEINCVFTPQKITLMSLGDESTYTSGSNKYYQYRYVLIPGGVKATSSVNWNNYQEVQQAVGMKD